MRHGKKVNHLGRTSSHRKAMMRNMASSLFLHKRITTTLAKAKSLRKYVEPLVTRSKVNSTHNRRRCFVYLQQKEAVTELFDTIAPRVGDRPGGYTRIVKLGTRFGDAAEMAIVELVDFNEVYTPDRKSKSGAKKKTRRRGGAKKAAAASTAAAVATENVEAAAETETEAVEAAAEQATEAVETASNEVQENVEEAKEAIEDAAEEVKETIEDATEEAKDAIQDAAEDVADEATDAKE